MTKNWLAVASADHVAIGRREGFMQVCHGKPEPLRRLQPGDRVVYYSPNRHYSPRHDRRGDDRLQAFTAIGTVKAGQPYRADSDMGFRPHRRDIDWHEARETPLTELVDQLELASVPNWGYRLRQGLVEISATDMTTIAQAMFTAEAPLYRQAA